VKLIKSVEYEQLDLHDLSKIQVTVWYVDGTVEQFNNDNNLMRVTRQLQRQNGKYS
jgi:hypothetical protein